MSRILSVSNSTLNVRKKMRNKFENGFAFLSFSITEVFRLTDGAPAFLRTVLRLDLRPAYEVNTLLHS